MKPKNSDYVPQEIYMIDLNALIWKSVTKSFKFEKMAPRYLTVSEIQSMNIVFFQLAATASVNVNLMELVCIDGT